MRTSPLVRVLLLIRKGELPIGVKAMHRKQHLRTPENPAHCYKKMLKIRCQDRRGYFYDPFLRY